MIIFFKMKIVNSTRIKQSQSNLQPQFTESKNLEVAAIDAKQRAIKSRQTVSVYELGGWESLFKNYVERSLEENNNCNNSSDRQTSSHQPKSKKSQQQPLCPSAQPDMDNAVLFGIVGGDVLAPQVTYLSQPQSITDNTNQLSNPVKPTEMFRIAASCEVKKCQHFDGANCRLAMRIVARLPKVVDTLPACAIRSSCRWWQQEGKSACLRCPQVATENYYSSELFKQVADPTLKVSSR
jgi:hypothetical protein